jgi:hypothetical protein
MSTKVAAGCASGAFAAMLLNPTELIKTRLMADARSRSGVSGLLLCRPLRVHQVPTRSCAVSSGRRASRVCGGAAP